MLYSKTRGQVTVVQVMACLGYIRSGLYVASRVDGIVALGALDHDGTPVVLRQ